MMEELTTTGGSLPAERTPLLIAAEINSIKDQTRKMVLFNSIEIGRRLVEAKSMIPHGEWGTWLEKSVNYSQSTANNLMRIFEEYGADQIAIFGDNAKSQALGNLSYTQAVALLGIPAEEREQFVKENDVENMSTRELQKLIKERDQALKEKEKLESDLKATKVAFESSIEKRNELRQEVEALNKQLQEGIDLRESYLKRIDDYKEKLAEAQASGDNDEVEQLRNSLCQAKQDLHDSTTKIADLERQLKEKPIEASAVVEVEKIPEEVEKELNELRQKVSQARDKAVIKFSLCFDQLVKGFNDLLGALGEISDPDTQAKYKGAVSGLLGKMSERL